MDNLSINNLLVPLDGSSLAESVLPVVSQLARKLGARVTLIHVIEKDAPEKIHGETHLTKSDQAEKYLSSVASSDIMKGLSVTFHVHEAGVRDVAQSISDHTEELDQDLVVMCTHGSSGLRGILFGSNAQQVISLGNTPVLLVKPPRRFLPQSYTFDKFLVALDGNPDHEQSLSFAVRLAKACAATLHLLIAIPQFGTMSGEVTPANRLLPGTTARMMDMIVPVAQEYLDKIRVRIESGGLRVKTIISRRNPSDAISTTVKETRADLIILATHGKKGAGAFWNGSLTPKISKSSRVPLLLIPVKG